MIQPAPPPAHQRPEIRVLPPLVVNQIAAGEVVERPASVVKELVDNAIDAGASRITIELEQGGIELVRVSDDGRGIDAGQLELAVHPHATSKIMGVEDLDAVRTMGFRGEALASIASVSRLTIRSKATGASAGAEVSVEGGDTKPIRPSAGAIGTSVTVANLFFNTPARRKFLRTPTTEQTHCAACVRSLALSHPAIGFTLRAGQRTIIDVPPGQTPRERALAVLGGEFASQYLEVHADQFDDARGVALWGLMGLPILAKPHLKSQHLFINGRPIRDKSITHALREAYRGLIEPGRHPAGVLMLEMSPGAVDVNVHPAKAEVRFRDAQVVHKVVYGAVRDALRAADLTPSDSGSARSSGWRFEPVVRPSAEAPAFARAMREQSDPMPAAERIAFGLSVPSDAAPVHGPGPARAPVPTLPDRDIELTAPRPASPMMQVHNSFLVTQDETGMVIIDQHALHERVMFEKLRLRVEAGTLESQRMLVPTTIEATPEQIEALDGLADLLAKLGVDAQPLGPRSVGVQAFPTLLSERGVDAGDFISDLLERAVAGDLGEGREGTADKAEAALHEVLDMMACKAAIKAGERLSDEELSELMRLRDTVERSSNCPHGRPTAIRLTIHELERQFGRSPRT